MKNLILVLPILLFLGSCNPDNPVPNIPDAPPNQDIRFLKGTIDNYTWNAVEFENGCFSGYGISSNEENTDSNYEVDDYYAYMEQDAQIGTISSTLIGSLNVAFSGHKYTIEDYYNNRENVFLASFYTGNNNYYSVTSSTNNGVEIYYIDANGEKWSSKYGPQIGSLFNVTQCETEYHGIDPGKKIKGTFSCKIYSSSNPTLFKTVTNGSFLLHFGLCQ